MDLVFERLTGEGGALIGETRSVAMFTVVCILDDVARRSLAGVEDGELACRLRYDDAFVDDAGAGAGLVVEDAEGIGGVNGPRSFPACRTSSSAS